MSDDFDIVDWLRTAPSNEWCGPMLEKAAAEIEILRGGWLADNERLRNALIHLVNEVDASMGLMEALCRREFGNTNYQCVMDRVAAARVIIDATNKRRLTSA